jgi:molybdate transport system regulatory protein
MQVRTNVWIEKEGQVALSRWRVALLQAVEDTGSISAAAQRMGIPYHRAWDKIHECEQRLGISLISTQTGGVGGGGARLTAEGAEYVRRFQQFNQGLDKLITQRFIEAFSGMELALDKQNAASTNPSTAGDCAPSTTGDYAGRFEE